MFTSVGASTLIISMASLLLAHAQQQPGFPGIPNIPGIPGLTPNPNSNTPVIPNIPTTPTSSSPNPSSNTPVIPNIPNIPGITPTSSSPNPSSNTGSACNFQYMVQNYNGCQSYVLRGKGANLQEECCAPMAKIAHECGCVPMLRPFANSLLGICNSPMCS